MFFAPKSLKIKLMSSQIEQELFTILKENFELNVDKMDRTTKVRDHLDSIDFLGFLMQVRKKYHIDIDPNEIKNLHTIEQIADLVKKSTGQA